MELALAPGGIAVPGAAGASASHAHVNICSAGTREREEAGRNNRPQNVK